MLTTGRLLQERLSLQENMKISQQKLLSLKVSAPQPLTRLGTYFLDINLQKDRDWYGEINKVNNIKLLKIPESLQLVSCDPAISVEGGQSGDPVVINSLLADKKDLTFS